MKVSAFDNRRYFYAQDLCYWFIHAALGMRFKVHRIRFVEYIPQAIHCLAFEDVKSSPRLAVSRADGSIELWSTKDYWHQQVIIPGCTGTSVESLVWCGKRLFSAGLHGEITEWDLDRLTPKATEDSFGGAVWSLAINHSQTHLAAGCEDGCVRLFEVTADGLQYYKALDRQEGRILSLSWHKSDQVLVVGTSDSTIRTYNTDTGHCTLRITMDDFHSRTTLVWTVHITSDYTIVSGDSLGNTQFWDGKQGTLIQGYRAHTADVLCSCVNKSEDMVFSAGVDNKLVQFQLMKTKDQSGPTWVRSGFTRAHSHDIRAIAALDSENILISGGVDTALNIYKMNRYGRSHPRRIPAFPHRPIIHLASRAQILMHQKPTALLFWRLSTTDGESSMLQQMPAHVLQINPKGDNHILDSAVSQCAKWVAFSDVFHTNLFRLSMTQDEQPLTVSKVRLPAMLPAQKLVFSSDSSRLILATNEHSIQVFDITLDPELLHTFQVPTKMTDLPMMSLLAASEDNRWIACSDVTNAVNVFDLKKSKHHCTLPTFAWQLTAMAFQPHTNNLALVSSNNQIYMYNTKGVKLTDWAREAAEKGLPKQWLGHKSKVIDISFSPKCSDLMILQDNDIFTLIDLREPLPDPNVKLFEGTSSIHHSARKRKSSETREEDRSKEDNREKERKSFKTCRKYQSLLFLGFNHDGSMVVVERPWVSILDSLPPTLHRKRYGT